ncbi:hypothetical protein [Delftia acidovorans]|uniref:Uncharacterized protein n=1 Tax=Delftia acidovorans TaxID=80866 RepID=A0AAJ2VD38_DELAC|nr:hypothetical protein [Delftia acidovorans]MDX4957227.1 hypothetical protein [Delftia acidovorans]
MYVPNNVPGTPAELPQFLQQELLNIQRAQNGPFPFSALQELHNEPAKLINGMVVLADGTDWNPGSGAGFYGYRGGAWRFLG